jgi:peptidoglycan/LPS O-acetylase OafA/YrhL
MGIQPPTHDIRSLTGIRAAAALWVMIYHFQTYFDGRTYSFGAADAFIGNGHLGVDLFFVLSGFIMLHVYASRFRDRLQVGEVFEFLQLRIARLYPVHVFTLALMLSFAAVGYLAGRLPQHPEIFSPQSVLASLLLVHAWIGWYTPNMPAWSISSEWFAYLCFPALALLIRWHRLMPVLFGMVAILGLGLVAEGPQRIVVEFPLGMAVYYVYGSSMRTPPFLGLTVAISLVLLLSFTDNIVHAYIGLMAILIVAVARQGDWLGAALSHPVIVYLGEISYSLYMTHWLVRIVFRELFTRLAPSTNPLIIISCYVVATVGAAALVCRWIELPGRRLLRNWPLKAAILRSTDLPTSDRAIS